MELKLDSKILKPMADSLEYKIQNLMTEVLKKNKTGEISLKIELSTIEREKELENGDVKIYKEPIINYQLTEKIKETKAVEKGGLGYGYKIEANDLLDDIFVDEVDAI